MGEAFLSEMYLIFFSVKMLSVLCPKLYAFKKLLLTNACCSFPKSSELICAISLQSRCDPLRNN